MKMFRFVKKMLYTELQGFYYLFLIISRGFFLIIKLPFLFIKKIFNNKLVDYVINIIGRLQENPISTLMITIVFSSFVLYKIYVYVPNDQTVNVEEGSNVELRKTNSEDNEKKEEDYNLYRKFAAYKMSDINFSDLKKINNEVVAWLIVDGTNINYPIVKTSDNSYYLDHDINKMSTINGWTFMDYRNNSDMSDNNTIFYGHNLFNKTAFGSISNLFTNGWYNSSNHKIIVLTESGKYMYEIFSIYYSEPDSSYLKNNYSNREHYQEFLNNIIGKSQRNFSVEVTADDNIITLSTCTDDNNGRKVIHAKLISNG